MKYEFDGFNIITKAENIIKSEKIEMLSGGKNSIYKLMLEFERNESAKPLFLLVVFLYAYQE